MFFCSGIFLWFQNYSLTFIFSKSMWCFYVLKGFAFPHKEQFLPTFRAEILDLVIGNNAYLYYSF